jgi:carboxyl-terminal processing protease
VSKKSKFVVLTFSLALVLFTVIGGLGVKAASTNDGAYRQLSVYSEVLSRIQSEYVEEPNVPKVTDGALHGLLESLDANSSYLTPAEYKEYRAHRAETKGHIGATISKRFGYAAVISILPGGPADKAGLENADIIEAIENRSTREMSLAEVISTLSGNPGSQVHVTVVRARKAEPEKLTIIRDTVNVPPATEKLMDSSIGYVKVDALPKGKAQEIANHIKSLEKLNARKLILDLRNSSDGDSPEGVALANIFMSHGMIGYLQGQKYPRETYNADPAHSVTNLPLVVLVNRGTAGPAEIAAAALLENARADVVGDKTFGVGSVQKVLEIPDGSALILSVAKYYSPSGKSIQDQAVTPNIQVADEADDFSPDDEETPTPGAPPKKRQGEDEQLNRAIQVLKNKDQKAELAAPAKP